MGLDIMQSMINPRSMLVAVQGVTSMPSITIRNLDETTKRRLRVRAASHDRSMEDEARDILRSTLNAGPPAANLADRIQARFGSLNGFDLELTPREPMRAAPELD